MNSPEDFIHLPFTPDLTQGGIDYAARSLQYTYDRMGGSLYSRLRRIVGGVAVELALRRMLSEREIPFDVRGATPFTQPDRYDVALGGHRCDLKTFILSKRQQISAVRHNPGLLLPAPALVPEDQFISVTHRESDLYLFAFLLGLTTNSQEEIVRAAQVGQPIYLIHPLTQTWSRPAVWDSLGRLALKSECSAPVTVELGGQDETREFVTEKIDLPPKTRVFVQHNFFNLAYLHVDAIPDARVGLQSPARNEIYLIAPSDWGNIWVYGMDIFLTGYISREEFRHKASPIYAGSRVFQYSKTQIKNFSVPMAELRPLDGLLEQVKVWEASRHEAA